MRYLFWGVMSLLAVSCTAAPLGVCLTDGSSETQRVVKTKTRLEAQTKNATIKVMTYKDDGIAMGTGTMFKYEGHNIVITAAHVLGGPPYLAAVLGDEDYVMAEVVYLDREADIAIMITPELPGVKPMHLKKRTSEGRVIAKNKGVKFGRKRQYSPQQAITVMEMRRRGDGYGTIGRAMGMTTSKVRRIIELMEEEEE